jgi:SAM-dependent methyltransferase
VTLDNVHSAGSAWLSVMRAFPDVEPRAVVTACGETESVGLLTADTLMPAVELSPQAGYEEWAANYGNAPTGLEVIEEPLVRQLWADLPPSRVLDAGCGTGRHAAWLGMRGHEVIGVDASPAMVFAARETVPRATYSIGTLRALPVKGDAVDAALCALTIAHEQDLRWPVAELARVVRPGGRVLVTEMHPSSVLLGLHALLPSRDPDRLPWIRRHSHLHETYMRAFDEANLTIRGVHELGWSRIALRLNNVPARWPTRVPALLGWPALVAWDLRVPDERAGGRPAEAWRAPRHAVSRPG